MTEVERICLAALDRPAEERAAFLEDACHGDEALRKDIESLLAHASPAEHFIEQPAVAGAGALAGLSGLSLGQRLGPYHIIARLGAGGMGEVYRARDTQLGRDVAIKILPVMYAADPERLARFEREARVLASLNHPHIAAIYGVEATPSAAGPHGRALVMELVEGPTLADRIADGPLRTAEALVIAGQIADALAAAHERGIIHRDLKPANIKVTPGGVVKVLDFGLAKVDVLPTFRTGETKEGVILGTAAYMSPEQSRGEAVDKRTDIWAFGCVVFEMLTGRSVFAAASVTETLSEVLKTEPDWQRLPADTPEGVRRLLRRCLTKDRARRLADIRDAQLDLDEAPGDAPHHAGRKSRVVSARWAIAVMAAVILIAALTWITSPMRGEETAPARLARWPIAPLGAAAIAGDVAITPDGTALVYVGDRGTKIFVRALEQLEPKLIHTAAAPLNSVFVSTDGQLVGFGEGGRMKKVAISGGPVQLLLDTGGSDATWAPDNTIIFVSLLEPGLRRVQAGGGDVEVLTRPDPARGELAHSFPEMLPGGRAVLFTITAMSGGPDATQVAVLDLTTGEYKTIVPGGSRAQYLPGGRGSTTRAERDTGHLVYAAGGALLAIPFDLDALDTRETAMTVVPRSASRQDIRHFDVAADGTLVYVDAPEAISSAARELVWVNRQGRETPLGTPPDSYRHPRLSPDDAQVAVAHSEAIWVWDVRRQTLRQRTFGRGGDFAPVWTTNGERLIFRRTVGLFWQRADGTGPVEKLGDGIPTGVTPDGKQVLFATGRGAVDLSVLALDGTNRVEALFDTTAIERNGVVSPNAPHWLAYESDSEGFPQIYVVPYLNVKATPSPVSMAGGTRPLWSRNGRELFFVAPDGAIMAVRVDSRDGVWSAGNPEKIVEGPYSTGDPFSPRNYDVSSDGQRFLMVKEPVNLGTPSQIIVVERR